MDGTTSGWVIEGPSTNRLRDKSAIGRPTGDGKLILSAGEIMFCHHYRNIPLPSEDWLSSTILENTTLLAEYAIIEALRVPGNKIVLSNNSDIFDVTSEPETWGIRWESDKHPRNNEPIAEVRWFFSNQNLDTVDIIEWSNKVSEKGRIAEVLVVDDELSVVTYRVSIVDPRGNIDCENVIDSLLALNDGISINQGRIYPLEDWRIPQVGIQVEGGIFVDSITCALIDGEFEREEVTILTDILSRGLHPRPGFKYGTEWRCYDKTIGEDHAPYLITLPSRAPNDWAATCLASRLASGVNKTWLIPVKENNKWNYLAITRPPADARWSNPRRR